MSDLLEGDGHPGYGMVVRSSLKRREDGKVDLVLQVIHHLPTFLVHRPDTLSEENQTSSAEWGKTP